LILSGCKPPPTPVRQPAPKPEVQKPVVIAAESWVKFVADSRSKCEENPGCTLDYDKLHEHDSRHFGVMVIGYKDSEYYVSLFGFDPKSDKWTDSPRSTPEDGYEGIDIPATSKEWNVPEAMISQWIDQANRTVQEIYSKRH
jgi:hypothetical protein